MLISDEGDGSSVLPEPCDTSRIRADKYFLPFELGKFRNSQMSREFNLLHPDLEEFDPDSDTIHNQFKFSWYFLITSVGSFLWIFFLS